MNKENYLKNPCGTYALPYWKQKINSIPEGMKVIHDRDFNIIELKNHVDTKYFRILHDLKEVNVISQMDDNYLLRTVDLNTEKQLVVNIINTCYTDISVDFQKVSTLMNETTFDNDLWVLAIEKTSGKSIGLGIANLDADMKEGSLEWLQVLPQYRNKGIGKLIVNELLCRLKSKALFVTVSGKVDNPTNPERLYRRCGFTGSDIWHVLYKKG